MRIQRTTERPRTPYHDYARCATAQNANSAASAIRPHREPLHVLIAEALKTKEELHAPAVHGAELLLRIARCRRDKRTCDQALKL